MAENDKVLNVYNALVKEGYDMESVDEFRENLKNPRARKGVYDALIKEGYDMAPYEKFEANIGYAKLGVPYREAAANDLSTLKPRWQGDSTPTPQVGLQAKTPQTPQTPQTQQAKTQQTKTQQAQQAKTQQAQQASAKQRNAPLSEASKARMMEFARGVSASADDALNRFDKGVTYSKAKTGLNVPTRIELGRNNNVVETGEAEKRYLTEAGNEYSTRAEAEIEQNLIDSAKRVPLSLDISDKQIEASQKPASAAIAAVWKEAEEGYKKDAEKNMKGSYGGLRATDLHEASYVSDILDYHKNNVSRMTRFDLQKMMDRTWQRAGKQITQSIVAQLEKQHPNASYAQLINTAEGLARQMSDNAVYKYAVAKNAPRSTLEYFLKTAGDANLISTIERGLASREAGTTGDLAAYEQAMNDYGKNHRVAQIGGSIAGMAGDPVTLISGGVGALAAKGALNLGGRLLLKKAATNVGTRLFGSTLGGRVAAGAAGGATNFGLYEGAKEAESQFVHGGHSAGDVLKATGRGLLLGSVSGTASPLIGNVADKMVKATSGTASKVGIRAGELVTSAITEGTIFSLPEWLSGKGDKMDVWTDNMAMVLGFKAQHLVKSAPHVIAGLRPVADPKTQAERNHNRMSFTERLRKQMNASQSDIAFTRDEKEELRKQGYGELAGLFKKKPPVKVENPALKDSKTATFDIPEAKDLLNKHPELDGYAEMERLMQDPTVSQSTRAKAYYMLTGRQLPMGTVTGYRTEKDEHGNVVVKAVTATGEVVTSKRFSDEAAANREQDAIKRQALLNTVDVGEQYAEQKANDKVFQAAIDAVAPGADLNTVKRNYAAVKAGDKDAARNYADMVKSIDDFLEKNKGIADSDRPEAIRTAIKEKTGVDVDKALKKGEEKCNETEKAAVDEYVKRLYFEEREAGGKFEEDAIHDRSRLLESNAGETTDKTDETEPTAGEENNSAASEEYAERMNEALQRCEDAFGSDAEERMNELQSDPWSLANDPNLTEYQQDTVLEYIKAKSALDKAQDVADDPVERKRRDVKNEVGLRTNKESGMIQPAVMRTDGRAVYIIKGGVVVSPDGEISAEKSGRSIIVRDAETGEYKFVSPDMIGSVGEAIDPQEELKSAYAGIEAEQEQQRGGNEAQGEPQAQTGENVNPVQEAPAHEAQGEPQAQTGENAAAGGTEATGEQHTALSRVPVDEKTGEPAFERTDPETALDALNEVTEGNEENTRAIVEAQVAQAEAALKALKKIAPTKKAAALKGSPMQMAKAQQEADAAYNAAMEQYNAQVSAAEEAQRAWTGILSLMDERKANEAAPVGEKAAAEESKEKSAVERTKQAVNDDGDTNLSKEKDENGRPFIKADNGTTVFGEITEESGLTAAPIKLSEGVQDENTGKGYGLVHIEANHGEQIRKAGFASVNEFVSYVATNYDPDNIRVGKRRTDGSETFLIQATDEHDNTLFIELSKDGSYWNVNSGGVFRKGYSNKKGAVAKTEPLQPNNAVSSGSSLSANERDGITNAEPNGKPTAPADKVTDKAIEKQEAGGGKKLPLQADAQKKAGVPPHTVSPKLKAKWDAAPKIEGNANAITLEDGTTLRGHYVLTEAGAATASHDVNNGYEPAEGFPVDENGESVNDRDYKRDKDAQRMVRDIADNYDSRALQSPVVVSKDGIVLSGNNRTMSGEIAAQQGTDKAYIDHLKEFGRMYGFTPEQVEGMKHPRVVFVPDEELPYDAGTFARFNAENRKRQNKAEHAVKLGKTVPDNVFGGIVDDIARYDSLSNYYADSKAVSNAISRLLDAGVINEMQLPELRTGNSLSASGKELIENTLIGKAFQSSPDAVRQIIGDGILRQSVIMALNEITYNRTLAKSGYDLTKELAAAIDLVYRARTQHPDIFKKGVPVSLYGRQEGLFDDEFGDSRVTDGITLLLADLLNGSKTADLRKVLSVYNQEAAAPASGQMDIFSGERISKEQILKNILEHFKNETPRELQAIIDAAVAERKRRAKVATEQRGRSKTGEQAKNAVKGGRGNTKGRSDQSGERRGVDEKKDSIKYHKGGEDHKQAAQELGVDKSDLSRYAEGMREKNTVSATTALRNLRARYIKEHAEEKKALMEREGISGLVASRRLFEPIEKAVKERYGDVDVLLEERRKRIEQERNVMEAARRRAEEEERKREARLEELAGLIDEDIDKRYADALEKGDEAAAREMLDEAARRKGYDDAESNYQGVGAWSAPSDPGFATAEERRADVEENGGDVNLEDIAHGYSPVQEEMYSHPERTGFGDETGIEAGHAINNALNALKAGKKDVKIKVYRAVPTSVKEGKLRNGDWVTPSRKYAEKHGENRLEGKYRIIEAEVSASELWFDGNDIREWGYDNGKGYRYKNAKNNRKLNDLVTRDDKGNVIPPSKRFNSRKADERYQKAGGRADGLTPEEKALRDALTDHLRESGIEVIADEKEGQRVLDMAGDEARTEAARHRSKEAEDRENTLRARDRAVALVTGRSVKEVRARRREEERKFKEETKDLYEKVLSGNFDEITLRQIKNFISHVTPRNPYIRPLSKRLPQRALFEVSKGERTGRIDALFSRISESTVRPDERTRPEAKRRIEETKKELLKKWAIASGNWHTSVSDFTDAKEPLGRGKDSDVYVSTDGKSVIKVSKGKENLKRFRPDIDNVALFNSVFPESKYEILGYGEIGGKFVRFLRQPIVDFTESRPLSVKERVSYMERLGFRPMNEEKTAFTNGEIVASDIQGNNIVKDKDGNVRVIDADMRLHTKDVGGNFSYPDVERDTAAPDEVKLLKAYHGSGADFDHFDHSHMGEGEGHQAYGWGTYVTEVEGIGRTYADTGFFSAEQRRKGESDTPIDRAVDDIIGQEKYNSTVSNFEQRKAVVIENLERNISNFKKGLEVKDNKYIAFLKEELERDKAELEALRTLTEEQYNEERMKQGRMRHLYTVEIPDDTGENYLEWDKPLSEALVEKVAKALPSFREFDVKRLKESGTGEDLYKTVSMRIANMESESKFNDDEKASKFLSSLGFAGIKYPANFMSGGNTELRNYVIFNEKDAKITDHVRFFRTGDGKAYGFTVGGKIYIDPRMAGAETPIHEYSHLWAEALRKGNTKEWKNVVGLMKGTSVWEEVKRKYPELKTDDEVADEVIAHYSGRRGAERLREEMRKAAESNATVGEKAKAVSALQRVKEALSKFWKGVADFLHIHYTTPEEVADRVLKDLLDGVDPRKYGKSGNEGVRFSAKKRRALETASLGESPRSLTVVSSADGSKVLKRIDALTDEFENSATQPKTFLGDAAKALGAERHGSASEYATFETKNGQIVTIRLADHNAKVSNFDNRNESEGISIVVSPKGNSGMTDDGKAHVVEYYYNAIKLRRAEGKPLADILRAIKQVLYSGEFKDPTGLAERQEVNEKDVIRFQLVGERGAEAADRAEEATTRLDNLRVAREMEKAGKDAKAVKMATGWERGADGKWRYEIPDIKYHPKGDAGLEKLMSKQPWAKELEELEDRIFDGENLSEKEVARFDELAEQEKQFKADFLSREKPHLADWVENEELFAAYPELKNTEIVFTDQPAQEMGGYYSERNNRIVVNTASAMDADSVIAHEIQHAIQRMEGFAKGGNPDTVRREIEQIIDENSEVSEATKERLKEWATLKTMADRLEDFYKPFIHSDNELLKRKAVEFYWDALNETDNNPDLHLENEYPDDATGAAIAESGYHVEEARKELLRRAKEIYDGVSKEDTGTMELVGKLRDALKENTDAELYERLSGEVEARNVQKRMNMTPEERRASLAKETEDVAREDQILLREGGMDESAATDVPTQTTAEEMTARVEDLSKKLGTPVRIIRTEEEAETLPSARQRRQKGSYNTLTGEVTIVVPNNAGLADIENTFIHEVVGHDGLRVLFPTEEKLNNALDELYRVSEDGIKETIDREAQKMYDREVERLREEKRKEHEAKGEKADTYGDMAEAHAEADKKREQFRRTATEEYGADLAGRIGDSGFEKMSAEELTFWGRLKAMLQKALDRLLDGLKIQSHHKWSDKDWAFVLHEAYKRKRNGGRPSVFDTADTEVMKRKTGFEDGMAHNEESLPVKEDVNEINQKFNDELQKQIDGTLPSNHIYKMGKPGNVLLSTGVPNLPIQMNASRLKAKATSFGHDFDLGEVKDLVKALQKPLAVFVYGDETKAQNIIVPLQKDGKNFIVGLSLNPTIGGRSLEINSIRNVFPKNNSEWLNWISQGKALYLDKEKVQNLIDQQRTILADVEYLDLDSVAKVVENFENPKVSNENEGLLFRDGDSEDYEKAIARDTYERRVKTGLYQTVEALQDSMLGLKEAMKAVLKAEGKKMYIEDVADYENPYRGENLLSSVNKAQSDVFDRESFNPLLKEVAKLAKTADERAELTDYMMAKHGLERNEVMAGRAAEKDARKEFEKELRGATRAVLRNPLSKDAQEELAKVRQEIADRKKELYKENRKRDYAGLTALTDMGDVGEAEREAKRMVGDYESKNDTTELWKRINDVSRGILKKTYESGLISRETYNDIRSMYKNYIPLRGFDETTSEEHYAYLDDRTGTFSAPIKTAKGRKSKADDPIVNLKVMADSAILQCNRNVMVKQKFLNFALNHPSDLISVSDLWLAYDKIAGEWKPVNTGDVEDTESLRADDSARDVERKMRKFDEKMAGLAAMYPEEYKKQKENPEIPYRTAEKRDLREHQVLVKRDGKVYVLTVNGNPRAAQAVNGKTNPDNESSGAFDTVIRAGEYVNRQLASYYTTRDLNFLLANFIRDSIYSNSIAWVKESPGYAAKLHKNWLTVANYANMVRLFRKWNAGTLDRNDRTENLFYQFMMNGGETGFVSLRDIEKRRRDIAREVKMLNGKLPIRKLWKLLGERIDEFNRAAENSARFAAFITSREVGRSLERSAYDAKEISVNFNKKGSGSKFFRKEGQTFLGNTAALASGFGRSLQVFWNAAIQGATNFGRVSVRHKKKMLAAMSILFSAGLMNAVLGGKQDDDDNDNEDGKDKRKKNGSWYYNYPEFTRFNNIIFRLPYSDDLHGSIPLPPEYSSVFGMGVLVGSIISGNVHYSGGEVANHLAGLMSKAMPLDFTEGGGGLHALIPSSIKPAWEIYTNSSWTGLPIYKKTTWNENMPEWTKVYKNANSTLVGVSKDLNELTGGDAYTKGWADVVNPASIEYMLNGYLGGMYKMIGQLQKMGEMALGEREFDPRSVMLLNRVVKKNDERMEQRAVNNEYHRIAEDCEELLRRLRAYGHDTKAGIFDYAAKINALKEEESFKILPIYYNYNRYIEAYSKRMKDEQDEKEKEKFASMINDLKSAVVSKADSIRSVNANR